MIVGLISPVLERLRSGMARGRARFAAREGKEGQGMVEYALIVVLIAIVVIVILSVIGAQVNNVFSNVSNGVST
jgi:pilus assembly protein Flp/PilA